LRYGERLSQSDSHTKDHHRLRWLRRSDNCRKKSIPVRWEGKRRLVRDSQGREVISEARFFCLEKVKPDDIAEYNGHEWPVITVSEIVDLDGNISHYEVAV